MNEFGPEFKQTCLFNSNNKIYNYLTEKWIETCSKYIKLVLNKIEQVGVCTLQKSYCKN